MFYIGIDPGLTGAVAILNDEGHLTSIVDTPTFEVSGGAKKKHCFDTVQMSKILLNIAVNVYSMKAALEDVHSMPEQGIVGAFSFGRGLGIWEGILAALGIPVHMVRPQVWKKAMMVGMGKEKDASRMRALQLFPHADLHLKKHHGRADALLMALWLYRQDKGLPNVRESDAVSGTV